jgi:acetate kinase
VTQRNVLVINSGSSSVKYQVISLPSQRVVEKGQRDRVGIAGGDFADHTEALGDIFTSLPDTLTIDVVGHRVVHGGSEFREPVIVSDKVLERLETLSRLAPLHNPPNLDGIRAARSVLPEVPQVAVFDTAFFATLEPAAFRYAIRREYEQSLGIRKYGFHGTSHHYVTQTLDNVAAAIDHPRRVVSFHLGNGSSVAAVKGGVAIDTSMGFTPLAGLVMGTRTGDVDPAVVTFMQRELGWGPDQVDIEFNRHSGLEGLAGHSDMRDVFAQSRAGDATAREAIEVWAWRARHFLGAYMAQLGGLDAVTFAGGIGENQGELRSMILKGCEGLGIVLDDDANAASGSEPRRISSADSAVEVWVIPTNEELQIARLALGVAGAAIQ